MKLLIAKTIYFVIGVLNTITFGLLLLSQYDYSTVYASASKDSGAKLIGWILFTVSLIFVIFPFYDTWKKAAITIKNFLKKHLLFIVAFLIIETFFLFMIGQLNYAFCQKAIEREKKKSSPNYAKVYQSHGFDRTENIIYSPSLGERIYALF